MDIVPEQLANLMLNFNNQGVCEQRKKTQRNDGERTWRGLRNVALELGEYLKKMQLFLGYMSSIKFHNYFWITLIKLWYRIAFNGGEIVDS